MCGIVGAIGQRNITPILIEGLKRLEYRGYDSAGIAILNNHELTRARKHGKVQALVALLEKNPLSGQLGIAHTRWATHGAPSDLNAHPHFSSEAIAVVHNGIIENHESLRAQLQTAGYQFDSQTDTEIIAHLLHQILKTISDPLKALTQLATQLEGAYALGIIFKAAPDTLFALRKGCPLVIGVGVGEHFLASDPLALLPVTQNFVSLEEGDIAVITCQTFNVFDSSGEKVQRTQRQVDASLDAADRGEYRHFMQKEIFEQPTAVRQTLSDRLLANSVREACFGEGASKIFDQVKHVHIVACGTSYHAGLVAKYWLESMANIACTVEIASEFRYRNPVVSDNSLFVCISQSGETADTLAALRLAKTLPFISQLAICNVAESTLVREAALHCMTLAGVEIGVASTKAFTTQLTVLALLTLVLGRRHGMDEAQVQTYIDDLHRIPQWLEAILNEDTQIKHLAPEFSDVQHALFLGRGAFYPIALEGALKLKEISYIHAEGYPAGELKHGPLALVDKNMPVVAVAPEDSVVEKLKSNLEEVRARGGRLYVFVDKQLASSTAFGDHVIALPSVPAWCAPIVYTVALQLLSYHVAVLRGTDVDKPRNLAKSVTVE